ncbi:VanZ family protein [Streptomyces carminius]|uniref:VanZ family protein n=1 Tax=Streptomyces carminius TaxID=2665496 RepID=A0A2M8LXY9_9ACTN|nr:VanZ family protein [Streptomyces carminius]PJE96811.1 VanZ family protein [Streptomyces carminius]
MGDINFEIGSATVLGPLLAVYCLLLAVRAARGRPGWAGKRAVTRLAGALYLAGVLSLTVFPVAVTYGTYANQVPWYAMVQPIPLLVADLSFVPNVVMLVPFGMLLPLISRQGSSLKRVTVQAALLSLSIEVTQCLMYVLFNNGRSVDVNDLIANTLGGALGYLVIRLVLRSAAAGELRAFALPVSAAAPETVERRAEPAPGRLPGAGGPVPR